MSIYNDVFCTSAPSTWYGVNHAIYLFFLVIMCWYTPGENNGFFSGPGEAYSLCAADKLVIVVQ